ncbi:MAG: putative ribonucleotide reductase large subunit [Verrucomicrobiales bacterium]|nr:putative ribonucleotide reductase large subunit [Verrucomicrobiales bacterium]
MKRKAEGQLDLLALVPKQAEADLVANSQNASAPSNLSTEQILVTKRDGTTEPFNKTRISIALESAFKAVRDIPADAPMTDAMSEAVGWLTEKISNRLLGETATLEVEYIQDSVEHQLMCDGYLTEARRYILYREDRRKVREQKPAATTVAEVSAPPPTGIDEKLAAHLLLKVIYAEAIPDTSADPVASHSRNFSYAIQDAVHNNLLAPELLMFDLEHLGDALQLERDELIAREGLEWLYANCFARERDRCVETPQYFWMRLAMAFAASEIDDKEARALEFYEVLSTLRFLPSEKLLRMAGRSSVVCSRIASEIEDIDLSARVAGHVNLAAHVQNGALDELLLYGTISSGVRLLDDVVESMGAKLNATALHAHDSRDVALGMVGLEQTLEMLNISWDAEAALNFAERSAESVAYYASLASSALAAERDSFPAYAESNWNMGALPFEALNFSQPATDVGAPRLGCSKDWLVVRAAIRQNGMRNAHVLAFTPAQAVEKIVGNTGQLASFSTRLKRLVRCKKWVDGKVWITLPEYLSGPDLEQAYLLAQQLGVRPYTLPIRVTLSEPFTDAAAATKVFKTIEKSS